MTTTVKAELIKIFSNKEGKTFGTLLIREGADVDVVLVACPANTPLGAATFKLKHSPKFAEVVL